MRLVWVRTGDWRFFGATENAGLEIDGQKLQEVENDGHSIKG